MTPECAEQSLRNIQQTLGPNFDHLAALSPIPLGSPPSRPRPGLLIEAPAASRASRLLRYVDSDKVFTGATILPTKVSHKYYGTYPYEPFAPAPLEAHPERRR